jgi:hypothetical protein
MEQTKETGGVKAKFVDELTAIWTNYTKSVEDAQEKLTKETEKVWSAYYRNRNNVAEKALRLWADTYADYLEACRDAHSKKTATDQEKVRTAWTAHVTACGGTPELTSAWRSAQETLMEALNNANKGAATTAQSASEEYTRKVRACLTANGLADLDNASVQFLMNQIAALGAAEKATGKA